MRSGFFALAITGTAYLAACSPPVGVAHQVEAELRQLDVQLNQAVATRDAAKIGAFYDDGAILMPTAEPARRGRDAIVEEWTHVLAIPGFENEAKLEGMRVASSGDLAYTYGSYRSNLMGEDGKMTVEPGKWITIWAKDKTGSWKIVMDTYNTDIKPPDHK